VILNPLRAKDGYAPLTHARLAYILTAIPTEDLYALKSKLEDADRRGYNPGTIFWKEVKTEQAYQAVKARA
jgi:hypothetical protein